MHVSTRIAMQKLLLRIQQLAYGGRVGFIRNAMHGCAAQKGPRMLWGEACIQAASLLQADYL